MTRGIGTNEFVDDATLFEQLLKQRGAIAIRGKSVCEFGTVICLNAFNLEFEGFKHILQEDSRGKGTQLIEAFNVTKARIFIDSSILVVFLISE